MTLAFVFSYSLFSQIYSRAGFYLINSCFLFVCGMLCFLFFLSTWPLIKSPTLVKVLNMTWCSMWVRLHKIPVFFQRGEWRVWCLFWRSCVILKVFHSRWKTWALRSQRSSSVVQTYLFQVFLRVTLKKQMDHI